MFSDYMHTNDPFVNLRIHKKIVVRAPILPSLYHRTIAFQTAIGIIGTSQKDMINARRI